MRLSLVSAVVLLGCGNESGERVADASVDATRDSRDGGDPVYNPGEGGEVRLEYVVTAAGNAATRATSFFYADPGSTKMFPFASFSGCTDLTGKTNWPVAQNPVGERVYLDPGSVVITGGPTPLMIPRRNEGDGDAWGRTHAANEWFHYGNADAATYLTPNTSYDVVIGGSAEMPAQIFDDVIVLPPAFDVTTPDLGPFALTSADHTFTFEVVETTKPAEVFSLVAFTGALGPAVMCMERPQDGSMTVPKPMADVVRATYGSLGTGTLVRQTFSMDVRELVDASGGTGDWLYFIAAYSYESSFTVP